MFDKKENIFFTRLIVVLVLLSAYATGCTSPKTLTLMPTPVIYQDSNIDPFAHLIPEQKSVNTHVFYATNRTQDFSEGMVDYGNGLDSAIHVGKATVRMGDPGFGWDDLYRFSISSEQTNPPSLTLEQVVELSVIPDNLILAEAGLTGGLQTFAASINAELARAVDKEIMIYVHGTKVDFANSAILTAEVDHFAGRDFVGLAFAWPSHQNILSYLTGTDVRRALNSSSALQRLLVFLAEHTDAEHINILSYSAGGKVTSKALLELRQSFGALTSSELKDKFRIGSVVFAAADVDVDIFLTRISAVSDLSDQVVITVSDNDNVLKAAQFYMGGNVRAGSAEAEKLEETFILIKKLFNVEIIDVSIGQDVRGFDIIGHHYWYRHPWMSSDIIFLMRTNLSPARRGLSLSETEGIWYLSADYPERIKKSAEIELRGQW